MNPIEFLKQNGHDPNNFRQDIPQGPAIANHEAKYHGAFKETPRRKAVPKKAVRRRPAQLSGYSLLDRFLIAKGFTTNGKTVYGPLVPYLLCDLVMITHDEYLKDLKGKEKYHCKQMMKNYEWFIKDFFACFSDEYKDQAVELMDEFGEYLHNHLEIFRLSVMQPLMEYPSEFRTLLSAICVCRLLTSQADLVYSSIYYTPMGKKIKHPQLQAMEYHSRQMFVWFTKRDAGANVCSIDLSDFPDIRSSMNRVNDRILEFIKEYDNSNRNQQ